MANNNRPISLLPAASKVCERVALNQFTQFMKAKKRLTEHQSGNIDHNKLLSKLKSLGTSSFALDWFRSYLNDRRQYVRIGSEHSTLCGLSHGVPQGSILGPASFNIYIYISMIYPLNPNLVHWNRMLMTRNCSYLFKLKILFVWVHWLMTILKE